MCFSFLSKAYNKYPLTLKSGMITEELSLPQPQSGFSQQKTIDMHEDSHEEPGNKCFGSQVSYHFLPLQKKVSMLFTNLGVFKALSTDQVPSAHLRRSYCREYSSFVLELMITRQSDFKCSVLLFSRVKELRHSFCTHDFLSRESVCQRNTENLVLKGMNPVQTYEKINKQTLEIMKY